MKQFLHWFMEWEEFTEIYAKTYGWAKFFYEKLEKKIPYYCTKVQDIL